MRERAKSQLRRCEIVEPLTAVAQYAHDHMALNILEIERAVSREN